MAWWRVRQLLAHALPALQLVLDMGKAERKARERSGCTTKVCSAPQALSHLGAVRVGRGRLRIRARLVGGRGQRQWHSRVRDTDPMNRVYSKAWAEPGIGRALGFEQSTNQ